MNDNTGRCAILLPHGILFRNEETEVRKGLVLSDKIEAVIGLGPNLFYNAPMEACILICNNNKAKELKNKVIFINAKYEVTRKDAESYLEDVHIQKIKDAYNNVNDIADFKRLVDIEEIEKNRFDLSIQKYVYISEINKADVVSVEDALVSWKEQHSLFVNSVNTLIGMLGS